MQGLSDDEDIPIIKFIYPSTKKVNRILSGILFAFSRLSKHSPRKFFSANIIEILEHEVCFEILIAINFDCKVISHVSYSPNVYPQDRAFDCAQIASDCNDRPIQTAENKSPDSEA